MRRHVIRWCVSWFAVLAFGLGAAAQAQTSTRDTVLYQRIAPIGQYLMADRATEIALARSAAPDSVATRQLPVGPERFRRRRLASLRCSPPWPAHWDCWLAAARHRPSRPQRLHSRRRLAAMSDDGMRWLQW